MREMFGSVVFAPFVPSARCVLASLLCFDVVGVGGISGDLVYLEICYIRGFCLLMGYALKIFRRPSAIFCLEGAQFWRDRISGEPVFLGFSRVALAVCDWYYVSPNVVFWGRQHTDYLVFFASSCSWGVVYMRCCLLLESGLQTVHCFPFFISFGFW